MIVIIDFHQLFLDNPGDPNTLETDVGKLIGYHLYREYSLDTGIYYLENRLLGRYCRQHLDILTHCRPIGELASRYQYRRSIIRIRNRDAYAILIKEASYE